MALGITRQPRTPEHWSAPFQRLKQSVLRGFVGARGFVQKPEVLWGQQSRLVLSPPRGALFRGASSKAALPGLWGAGGSCPCPPPRRPQRGASCPGALLILAKQRLLRASVSHPRPRQHQDCRALGSQAWSRRCPRMNPARLPAPAARAGGESRLLRVPRREAHRSRRGRAGGAGPRALRGVPQGKRAPGGSRPAPPYPLPAARALHLCGPLQAASPRAGRARPGPSGGAEAGTAPEAEPRSPGAGVSGPRGRREAPRVLGSPGLSCLPASSAPGALHTSRYALRGGAQ